MVWDELGMGGKYELWSTRVRLAGNHTFGCALLATQLPSTCTYMTTSVSARLCGSGNGISALSVFIDSHLS